MASLSGLSSGWLSQVLTHHIPADGLLGMLLMLGPALLKLCAQGCIDCQSVFLKRVNLLVLRDGAALVRVLAPEHLWPSEGDWQEGKDGCGGAA
jgi:hypothetical protein